MSLIVRHYRRDDAEPLADLLRRSVGELGPVDYSAEQVRAWLKRLPDAKQLDRLSQDGRHALVAVDREGGVLALAHLEKDGHIHLFFCAPEVTGQGVGGQLYNAVEALALEEGIERLYVEASEAARRLFLKKGFSDLNRRDFELHGVAIHNYAMEKILV